MCAFIITQAHGPVGRGTANLLESAGRNSAPGSGAAFMQGAAPFLQMGAQHLLGQRGADRNAQRELEMAARKKADQIKENQAFFEASVKGTKYEKNPAVLYAVTTGQDVRAAIQFADTLESGLTKAEMADATRRRGQDINDENADLTRAQRDVQIKQTGDYRNTLVAQGQQRIDNQAGQFGQRMGETVRHNKAMETRQTGKSPDLAKAELEDRYADADVRAAQREYGGFMDRMQEKYLGDLSQMDASEQEEERWLNAILRSQHAKRDAARKKRLGLIGPQGPAPAAQPGGPTVSPRVPATLPTEEQMRQRIREMRLQGMTPEQIKAALMGMQ